MKKDLNLLYLSGLITEEQMRESEMSRPRTSAVDDILMILNSHADNLGFKYPLGNKELTEKVKELESAGKIHYDELWKKWKKGKGKKS